MSNDGSQPPHGKSNPPCRVTMGKRIPLSLRAAAASADCYLIVESVDPGDRQLLNKSKLLK
jgi:hypothetical protein